MVFPSQKTAGAGKLTVKLGALTEIVEGKGILCDYPISNNKLLRKLFFVIDN